MNQQTLNHKPGMPHWLVLVIVPIIAMVIFSSCGTTNKTRSSHKEKTEFNTEEKKGIDTTAKTEADILQQLNKETSAGSLEETETNKELNIEFNNNGNGTAEDYTKKPLDTVINGTKIKTNDASSIKVNPDGSIEAKGNIKNVNYKETGKAKRQDSARTKEQVNTNIKVIDEKKGVDTTAKKASGKTEVSTKNKTVVTKGPGLWQKIRLVFWIFVLVALVLYGLYKGWWFALADWIRKIWAVIKKRRRDKSPPKNI